MMTLDPKPVRRSGEAAYPTKLQVLSDPKLLEQHVPIAWLSRKEVAAALAVLFAAGAAGCGGGATVAPVFHHGEGRGATGCIVSAPPVFLSEEEAIQVIREELSGYGLQFARSGVELPSVKIPKRGKTFDPRSLFRYEYFTNGEDVGEPIILRDQPRKTLEVDLSDPSKSVAIEFVSVDDYYDVGGASDFSSVQEYDMPDAAEFMCAQVREKGREKIHFGAFYDPMPDPDDAWNRPGGHEKNSTALAEDSREESKRLLREQVKEFAEWLKAQGVI